MKKVIVILSLVLATVLFAQSTSTLISYSVDATTGAYVPNDKTEKTLNADGNVTDQLKFNYDSGNWVKHSKTAFEYNGAGLFTKSMTMEWNGTEWVNQSSRETTYNGSGLVEMNIFKEWNGTDWINQSSNETAYNGEGQVTSYITKTGNGTAWQNERKTITVYVNGRIDYKEQQTYNGTNWVNVIREEMTYTADGLQSVLSLSMWDGSGWNLSSKTFSMFDAAGNVLQELVRANMGGVWDDFFKQDWTYTNTNKFDTWEEANYMNGEWVPSMRTKNQYDDQDRLTQIVWETYDGSAWAPSWKEEYSYAVTDTDTDTETAVKMAADLVDGFILDNNYPNPFNPSTQISFTLPAASDITLTVHNMLGKTVAVLANGFFTQGEYTKTFIASELAGGQYFYKLETAGFVEVKKMVLVK